MKFLLMSLVVLMAACNDSTGSSAASSSSVTLGVSSSVSSSSEVLSSSSEESVSSSSSQAASSSSEALSSSSDEGASSSNQEVSSSSVSVSSSVETSSSSIDIEPSLCAEVKLGNNELCDARDGQVYKYVVIGQQTWMAENLNYESESDSYCYGNDYRKCATYGRLYTWYVAAGSVESDLSPSGVQGICPTGWHLPSGEEWEVLAETIANEAGVGQKEDEDWTYIGPKMKSTSGWSGSLSYSGNGTDDFGFAGAPAGSRNSNGSYSWLRENAYWWSSTEYSSSTAYYRNLNYLWASFDRRSFDKSTARSVRCVKD